MSAQEFHSTPNVVKYRTMADSGKKIPHRRRQERRVDLDVRQAVVCHPQSDLAVLAAAIAGAQQGGGNVAQPQLGAQPAPAAPAAPGPNNNADIDPDTQALLMRHTEYWLAVNGIKDQAVADSAQPAETATSPSIPSL